jgi:hypothetical protein
MISGVTWTLVVIDHGRLQGAAWAEFHAARKRLEKASRDLHRHETEDVPAYEAWLHRTFPVLLTALRNLQEEVDPKSAKVREVQTRAAMFGGSHKRLWKDLKVRGAQAAAAEDGDAAFAPGEEEEEDDDWPGGEAADRRERTAGPAPSAGARDLYRRLVQHLHPDRGGAWTSARQQLWHEVQAAWAAADADWLARLEVEWETANEVLSAASPLSRLRAAITELDAARRDTERKLREYRRAPAWRFTTHEKKRPGLQERVERLLRHDLEALGKQLRYLNATIAAWEEDWTQPGTRSARGAGRMSRRWH